MRLTIFTLLLLATCALLAPSRAEALYKTRPMNLSKLLADAEVVAIATAVKADPPRGCTAAFACVLRDLEALKGEVKAVPKTGLDVRCWQGYYDADWKFEPGSRVLVAYSLRKDAAHGVLFAMDKDGALGFKVKHYFDILNLNDKTEKESAFLKFAKTELNALVPHPLIQASVAYDLLAGLAPIEGQELEDALTKAALHEKTPQYCAEALCYTLDRMQSKHLVAAVLACAHKADHSGTGFHDLTAKNKDVRAAFTQAFVDEKNEALFTQHFGRFHYCTPEDAREAFKQVWTKNKPARETLSEYLPHVPYGLKLLEELRKTE